MLCAKFDCDCDCDNPTTIKENIYKKQKLDNLQDQEAATPPETQEYSEKRNTTTPGPIKTFLEGFKFKNKIKKQENPIHQKPQKPPLPPTPLPPRKEKWKWNLHVKIHQIKE